MKIKKIYGIIIFTIVCIMLISGMILYERFSVFKENKNIIKEDIESISGTEFAFFVDNEPINNIPKKSIDYSLNTYKSKCYDSISGEQLSNVSWDNEKWKVVLKDITNTKSKCELYFDKIYVDEVLKKEDKSAGPIPNLGNGRLVPIRIEIVDNKPVVKKANIFEEWYNYSNKEWANAVILKDEKEDNYTPGTEIKEDDIESYFVWIPRYEYQIWNGEEETNKYTEITDLQVVDHPAQDERLNKAKEIQIKFVTNADEVHNGKKTNEWLTHPAFTAFNSNGFWVGKFETSKNGNNANNSISPEFVQIKPNVSSWRSIRVANAFYTTYDYQRELDSHMMKNMEWGAVAYLTNSKYGRCLGGTCTEVRINNNSDYITGSSAVNEPTCGYTGTNLECNKHGTDNSIVVSYVHPDSVHSSTTDNYYGIYDMAGGTSEYVMGVMADLNGKPTSGRNETSNSGFKGLYGCPTCENQTEQENTNGLPWPSSKYYDLYDYDTTDQHYYRGKLGDGTKEFGPFYRSTSGWKESTSR